MKVEEKKKRAVFLFSPNDVMKMKIATSYVDENDELCDRKKSS